MITNDVAKHNRTVQTETDGDKLWSTAVDDKRRYSSQEEQSV